MSRRMPKIPLNSAFLYAVTPANQDRFPNRGDSRAIVSATPSRPFSRTHKHNPCVKSD